MKQRKNFSIFLYIRCFPRRSTAYLDNWEVNAWLRGFYG